MLRKSRKHVGLIGLGIIGARAAATLRAAGWHVYVWNRSPKPVANFLGSPAEVAETCEIVQLFVADAQAVFAMIEAFADALTERHIVVCSATIGPEATLEAARLVEARGARFLDAPFTGSRGAAERAQLVYYIGGDEAVYARSKPVLEATSKAIVRCGKVGDAATLKIVTNLISAVTTQTLAEVLAITRRAGIAPDVVAAAIEQNACRSGVIELKLPKMVAGDYEPHFSLKHMFKDVQLGIHLANALDLEVPATTVTAGVMYGALNQGWGDLDYAALFKTYEIEFSRFTQRELAGPEVEQLPEAKPGAGRAAHDAQKQPADVVPVEVVVEPVHAESEKTATHAPGDVRESKPLAPDVPAEPAARDDAGKGAGETNSDDANAVPPKSEGDNPEPATPADPAPGGMPEATPLPADAPVEPAARNDSEKGAAEANSEDAKAAPPKIEGDKPEAAKPDTAGSELARDAEPKAEAAKDANGGDALPKIGGESDGAKPARPFNRILRRFFSPAAR